MTKRQPPPTEPPTSKWADQKFAPEDGEAAGDAPADEETVEQAPPIEGAAGESDTPLEAVKIQLQETQAKLLSALAETENVRRRARKEIDDAHKYGIQKFAKELLAIIDSLERAQEVEVDSNAAMESMREGIDLTLQAFHAVWEKFGIQTIHPLGEVFDPSFHEAVSTQEDPEAASNTVLVVVQKGYVLNERLLRPAMVVVAK